MVQGTAQLPSGVEQRADERLVAVRADVLNDVEHAVGNLLQRMHHAARTASPADGAPDGRLQGALTDLERLLELLFDYVSPVDLEPRGIAADRVAESLAAQLRGQGAGEVAIEAAPSVAVLADLRSLSRSFQLLTQACGRDWAIAGPVSIGIVHDRDGARVTFSVLTGGEVAPSASAVCSLAIAVAARLVDLQGGELRERPRAGCICTVMLPAAS